MKRVYESMMILKSDLAEKDSEEVFLKITQKIESLEGVVLAANIWAKEREFYFPLRSSDAEKKKYSKGCYWLVKFSLDTEKLSFLKETIRLEERILRNIIIKVDKKAEKLG